MDFPKYLYHYTNLSSLCSILKSGMIRFNPLTKMDDMDEAEIRDFKNFAKYVFVSSWTSDSRESIPFWNMYTRDMSGIRLRLKAFPFETYEWDYSPESQAISDLKPKYFPKELAENDRYAILPLAFNLFFLPVEYTDDEGKIYPSIQKINGSNFTMELNEVGKYKRKEWEFQSEWRYRLVYFDAGVKELGVDPGKALERMEKGAELAIDHVDLKLTKESLSDVEILTGPKMSSGDKELLRLLCEKYCTKARIQESRLKIR